MNAIVAHNVICPLGETSAIACQVIKAGRSWLEPHDWLPFPFTASLFNERQKEVLALDGYTFFEALAIRSIQEALSQKEIPLDDRTVLILSSTKGNVGDLTAESDPIPLGESAKRIARTIGLTTTPITVSNACISGVSAMILAARLIDSGQYDHAIVCGVDVQSPFIIAGFQSLKALSEEPCRPFDIERLGLNLGEAAATVIMSDSDDPNLWRVVSGATRNDAHHISSPAPKGDGALAAIQATLNGFPSADLALINAHGTATMYNDQMESVAIERAGLSHVPVNALKGCIGHTMGAAGIIETILNIKALDDGVILPTRGFDELGVSGKINVVNQLTKVDHPHAFLKIISGFGGCNAAMLLAKGVEASGPRVNTLRQPNRGPAATLSGSSVASPSLRRMDPLARLGVTTVDTLLNDNPIDPQKTAIILFNSQSSIHADRVFQRSIANEENFFPSPSAFVYTLPNIVAGEIAIRHQIHGETCFYILPEKDQALVLQIINATFADEDIDQVIGGWLEYIDARHHEADLEIYKRKS
ncbi:MAG: 3-oxoacyl-ACP synthase [Bacteroidales bacterium]|nr:3-oxoacyl-ACP synthase [Bacteroidales bacterium]MCD8395010.1 3-oxoacyl-ACP synthase [Bacteroidales bacterium]